MSLRNINFCKKLIFHLCIILSSPQCISVVNNARNGTYGEDRIMAVELKYGGKQKKDSFWMVSSAWVDEKGPQRVLGFALPALTRLEIQKISIVHWCYFWWSTKRILSGFDIICHGWRNKYVHADIFLSYDYKKQTSLQHHLDEHTIMHRWV